MKRRIYAGLAAAWCVAFVIQLRSVSAGAGSSAVPINPPVNCNTTKPDAQITPALLSSGMPCTLEAVAPFDLDNLQHAFDFNSWLTFLAINAPASGGVIGKDAPTVWEKWEGVDSIFLAGGQTPKPWGHGGGRPPACKGQPDYPVIQMVAKTPGVLTDTIQPFNTGPLIDQNGQYVRYEILVNQPMFEYIAQNTLYNTQGQEKFQGPIDFPEATLNEGTTTGTMGAIVIKASWKLLDLKKEDPSKFHTAKVLIYNPPLKNPPAPEGCFPATVGLTGIHIVHHTSGEPQWIWATFEHVDNDPSASEVKAGALRDHYNFYDPKCATCTVNKQLPRPWNPARSPYPGGLHNQIVREIDLTDATKKLNTAFQGILTGTVWQNYMLVSTQWPTQPTSTTDPTGAPAPQFLGNSTMETYIQGKVPNVSSSCMLCHNQATDTTGRASNFTYVLERAQPLPTTNASTK